MDAMNIKVELLGECAIRCGDRRIDHSGSRSRKIWLALVYLICHRHRFVPQEELAAQLWGQEKSSNPGGALKTTLWRARALLDSFGEGCGHQWIVCRGSAYRWEAPGETEVDAEVFEALCKSAETAAEPEEKLAALRTALALYKGVFLEKFSSELWVEAQGAYYHHLYVEAALETLSLLHPVRHAPEIVALCRDVLKFSPYQEELYRYLMRALMIQQEYQKAENVYEDMRDLLHSQLGLLPSEESRALYEEIHAYLSTQTLTADMLRSQLEEVDPPEGALFCDFTMFKMFYRAEARAALRRGDTVHVVLMTVKGADGGTLTERRAQKAMEQLRGGILSSLRRGDIVARCSATQFAVLLLQANYENSHKVCRRIVSSFAYAHPKSPARVHYTVLPLEPFRERFSEESGAERLKKDWGL